MDAMSTGGNCNGRPRDFSNEIKSYIPLTDQVTKVYIGLNYFKITKK